MITFEINDSIRQTVDRIPSVRDTSHQIGCFSKTSILSDGDYPVYVVVSRETFYCQSVAFLYRYAIQNG